MSLASAFDELDMDVDPPTKKLALSDANIPRYNVEFLEDELLGIGEFGSVFKCTKRLDGIEYAVKKSIRPVTGSNKEYVKLIKFLPIFRCCSPCLLIILCIFSFL